ncbi:MAG: carbonic anhydrase [Polyangiaceae bacterium]
MQRDGSDEMPTAEDALRSLVEGNRRFRKSDGAASAHGWSHELADSVQRPFAVVLGCSDSRTPVEIVFDQGFGELFVVRVAGNIVAPSVVGSIEFAVSQYGTRLVVVMGHTRCGAIGATVQALETGAGPESKNIRDITDRIAPHIQGIIGPSNSEDVIRQAMRANVRHSAEHLRRGSRILEELVLAEGVLVVGAEYELETGFVRFFDGVPESLLVPPSPGSTPGRHTLFAPRD